MRRLDKVIIKGIKEEDEESLQDATWHLRFRKQLDYQQIFQIFMYVAEKFKLGEYTVARHDQLMQLADKRKPQ